MAPPHKLHPHSQHLPSFTTCHHQRMNATSKQRHGRKARATWFTLEHSFRATSPRRDSLEAGLEQAGQIVSTIGARVSWIGTGDEWGERQAWNPTQWHDATSHLFPMLCLAAFPDDATTDDEKSLVLAYNKVRAAFIKAFKAEEFKAGDDDAGDAAESEWVEAETILDAQLATFHARLGDPFKVCSGCKKFALGANPKRCCGAVRYCSTACQRGAWKKHRKHCQKRKQKAAKEAKEAKKKKADLQQRIQDEGGERFAAVHRPHVPPNGPIRNVPHHLIAHMLRSHFPRHLRFARLSRVCREWYVLLRADPDLFRYLCIFVPTEKTITGEAERYHEVEQHLHFGALPLSYKFLSLIPNDHRIEALAVCGNDEGDVTDERDVGAEETIQHATILRAMCSLNVPRLTKLSLSKDFWKDGHCQNPSSAVIHLTNKVRDWLWKTLKHVQWLYLGKNENQSRESVESWLARGSKDDDDRVITRGQRSSTAKFLVLPRIQKCLFWSGTRHSDGATVLNQWVSDKAIQSNTERLVLTFPDENQACQFFSFPSVTYIVMEYSAISPAVIRRCLEHGPQVEHLHIETDSCDESETGGIEEWNFLASHANLKSFSIGFDSCEFQSGIEGPERLYRHLVKLLPDVQICIYDEAILSKETGAGDYTHPHFLNPAMAFGLELPSLSFYDHRNWGYCATQDLDLFGSADGVWDHTGDHE